MLIEKHSAQKRTALHACLNFGTPAQNIVVSHLFLEKQYIFKRTRTLIQVNTNLTWGFAAFRSDSCCAAVCFTFLLKINKLIKYFCINT